MSKQSQFPNYFIWIRKKKLKMSDSDVRKVNSIKFVNILSSLKRGWKKLCKNNLFSDFDRMSSVFTCIKKSLAILILFVLFLGSILVIFFVGRWSSYPEEMRANRPTPFELHLLANYTENTYNEKLVSSIEKSSRASAQDVLSNMTLTSMAVLISLYAFLIVIIVYLFQSLESRNNEAFQSLKSTNTEAFNVLANRLLQGQVDPTTAPAPTQSTSAIISTLPPPIITSSNLGNANSSPSSQGVTFMCCQCFRGTDSVTTDHTARFNKKTDNVVIEQGHGKPGSSIDAGVAGTPIALQKEDKETSLC